MREIRAEPIWATALAHPLRVRILRQMLRSHAVSPADLARPWEIDAGVMRRHFHRLRDLGLIKEADRPERRSRGASTLRDRQATREALWRLSAPIPVGDREERLAARITTIESPRRTALERLRLRREEVGLSQPELARRAGLNSEMLGRIERGRVDPRLSIVLVLADELDYPPEQLFAGTPAPHAETCR